jgi:HAE1 family hydrophobic/amphiphilic exporter-1
MSGIVGRFFYQFGLTVVFATLFSLLVSFTLTPLLASRFLENEGTVDTQTSREKRPGIFKRFGAAWDHFYNTLALLYRGSLESALGHRKWVIIGATLLFFFSIFILGKVGGEFMPVLDEGYISIAVEMPPGSSLKETNEVLHEIENILRQEPDAISILASVGGVNMGVEDGAIILKIV